jgi:hypothetical protein
MMDEGRRKSAVLWVVALLIALPALYVASFGPAFWMIARSGRTHTTLSDRIYWPIGWSADNGPHISRVVRWYAAIGLPTKKEITLPSNRDMDAGMIFSKSSEGRYVD